LGEPSSKSNLVTGRPIKRFPPYKKRDWVLLKAASTDGISVPRGLWCPEHNFTTFSPEISFGSGRYNCPFASKLSTASSSISSVFYRNL